MKVRRSRCGMVLVASIMLFTFASLAVLGVSIFIIQRLLQHDAEERHLRCLYSAAAGVHEALYFYRFRDLGGNGYFSLGQTSIDANNRFTLAAQPAELLMVNTAATALGGTRNREVRNISLQNATNSQTITIDRIVVTWNNSRRLTRIRINGRNVWNGSRSSPANANINNVTLNATPSTYPVNYLRFSGDMTGATVSLQFIMTGGTSKSVSVFPASSQFNFIVQSTGTTTGSSVSRILKAEYNALTGRVVDYDES